MPGPTWGELQEGDRSSVCPRSHGLLGNQQWSVMSGQRSRECRGTYNRGISSNWSSGRPPGRGGVCSKSSQRSEDGPMGGNYSRRGHASQREPAQAKAWEDELQQLTRCEPAFSEDTSTVLSPVACNSHHMHVIITLLASSHWAKTQR